MKLLLPGETYGWSVMREPFEEKFRVIRGIPSYPPLPENFTLSVGTKARLNGNDVVSFLFTGAISGIVLTVLMKGEDHFRGGIVECLP